MNLPVPASPALPEQVQLEKQTATLIEQACAVAIRDQASYDAGVELLRGVKALRIEAENHHRPVISAAHAAHKAALTALKRIDDPLEQAEELIKREIGKWDTAQKRLAAEAERAAREEAERLTAEALERELERMEREGATEREVAAAIVQAEEMPPMTAPVAAATYQQAAGISTSRHLKAEVRQMAPFLAWVAKDASRFNLLSINQPALNALLRAHGRALKIPGVSVYEETSVGVRL